MDSEEELILTNDRICSFVADSVINVVINR